MHSPHPSPGRDGVGEGQATNLERERGSFVQGYPLSRGLGKSVGVLLLWSPDPMNYRRPAGILHISKKPVSQERPQAAASRPVIGVPVEDASMGPYLN